MDKNNFSELHSAINKISPNMDSIKHSLDNFSKKYHDLELRNIDNELIEIKKILDSNNIQIKNINANQKDSIIDSINDKFNQFKDDLNRNN